MIPADLLDQLREKDPELCDEIYSEIGITYDRSGDELSVIFDDLNDAATTAWIQHCLQEAIREREWGLQQEYVPWFHATHYIGIGTQNGDLFEGVAATEAEALMRAYLSALSGERI